MASNPNLTQQVIAQRTEGIAVEEEQRTKNEQLIESNSNKRYKELDASDGETNRPHRDKRLKKTMSSTTYLPETIDLTSDQDDAGDILDGEQDIGGQTQPNIRQQKAFEEHVKADGQSLHSATQWQSFTNSCPISQSSDLTVSMRQINSLNTLQSETVPLHIPMNELIMLH